MGTAVQRPPMHAFVTQSVSSAQMAPACFSAAQYGVHSNVAGSHFPDAPGQSVSTVHVVN